jgi:multidrug efflux pump subunit AcrB
LSTQAVTEKLRQKTANVPGLRIFFYPLQELKSGARVSDSRYQFTLWDTDYDELLRLAPRVLAKMKNGVGVGGRVDRP